MQAPPKQVCPRLQAKQALPWAPQAAAVPTAWHSPPAVQQPVHVDGPQGGVLLQETATTDTTTSKNGRMNGRT
jgi:hypothetical protein